MRALTILFCVLVGCSSSGAKEKDPEPLAECEAYASQLQTCIGSLGRGAGQKRAEETRASLRHQALEAKDDAAREKLRGQCADGQRRLATTCR
jgi:hypothetical protein